MRRWQTKRPSRFFCITISTERGVEAMEKNSQLTLVVPGTTTIEEVPMPVPQADQVLIKVHTVGICGSDIHAFESGPFIPPKDPSTKIGLGHECAGTVVQVGEAVTKFAVGDRVCIEPGVPCGVCRFCRTGRYNLCFDMDFMATQPNYRGALTNYLCHPESMTFPLPEGMSFVEGALVEPAAVGVHAAMEAGVQPGQRVVVLGAGCIGLMTVQACKLCGADDIIVVDVMDKRLDMAKKLGATEVVNASREDTVARCKALLDGIGADVVFESAGSRITAQQAPDIVMRGGKIMIVGTIPGETPINFLKINREVRIQTVFRYANRFDATIRAIAEKRMDVASMVTHRYPYGEAQRAFEESVHNKADIIKGIIEMEP